MKQRVTVFWFRRDLRLNDNAGFSEALKSEHPVLPVFIFDPEIISKLPIDDARITFIYNTLQDIRQDLEVTQSSGLALFHGKPKTIFKQLIQDYDIDSVYTNHDYEPYALERDNAIHNLLNDHAIAFKTFKDQVIFEQNEIVKQNGEPYVVFTSYMKAWKVAFEDLDLRVYNTNNHLNNLLEHAELPTLSLKDIGFKRSSQKIEPYNLGDELIAHYDTKRNIPSIDGTSRLGPHLRFGTISVREAVSKAAKSKNEIFLNELIWREFFMQILWHFPKTVTDAFKSKYDQIKWRNNEEEFIKWCKGKTGYPLVDAGMRQLNQTGYMHNRVRMVVGSFLCKHLLIDWRWGEAYFAEKLHDYDMASNVGNWQWVAGCGVDAAPYFRIFNPTTQLEKFDRDNHYIKTWVPEYQELTYPQPIVDHKLARERCLNTYRIALN